MIVFISSRDEKNLGGEKKEKMKKIVAILMAMMMVISVTVVLAGGADKETQPNNKKVIVGFEEPPNEADEKMIRDCGGKTKYTYHIIDAKAVEIPEQAIENIKKNPRVKYVEEDGIVQAVQAEVIPWGVDRIDADLVWSANKGTEVEVAIIDTGIDKDHPDLQANIKGGVNFVSNHHRRPADPDKWDDDNGHGTHCAGIVAAVDNDIGVIGVAPEAYLYGVKVLDRTGSGYVSDVIAGIQWSKDNGMQVISMSLGGGYSESMETACSEADGAGIVVVAAAGNSGPGDNTVNYPAKYELVIAVSATDDTDAIASLSSRGPEIELAAPGVSIYSTYRGGGYATMSGTSMACPHVAGTAALVIAAGEGNVRQCLQNTAEDLGDGGRDNLYGYGLVDADEAVPSTGNQAPVADAGEDQTALVDETVSFDGSGSSDLDGTIMTYDWDFGDGTTETGKTTTYVYLTAETYTVTLTVTDDEGATGTDTASVFVTAPNEPPVADANGPYTGIEGDEIHFDGTGSDDLDGDRHMSGTSEMAQLVPV
jgi:subtilisin family serine protease